MSKLFVIACLSFLVNATAQMRAMASAASTTQPLAGSIPLNFLALRSMRWIVKRWEKL